MFKGAVIVTALFAIACGDPQSTTSGFSTDDKLLKGSAFDDSQNSSGGNLGLRIRCEVRSDRSKISVDANNIASGTYKASVTSGGVEIFSGELDTIGDEVEFDFDSENDDIDEGATAIDANFIQGGVVTGKIYAENGDLVAGLENVSCEIDD